MLFYSYHWNEKVIAGQEWAMAYYSGGADNRTDYSISSHLGMYTITNRKGAIVETGSPYYYHYNQLHRINNTDGPHVQTGSWVEIDSSGSVFTYTRQGIFIHTTRRETWIAAELGSQ